MRARESEVTSGSRENFDDVLNANFENFLGGNGGDISLSNYTDYPNVVGGNAYGIYNKGYGSIHVNYTSISKIDVSMLHFFLVNFLF